jgi:Ricin-type beta-trefoil lectin domain
MRPCILGFMALLSMALGTSGCVTARQIASGNTNMCMNVENHGYPVAGTPIKVKGCDPWRNQQWILNKGQITGVGGFCVDVDGSLPKDGAAVLYVPCNGRPSQSWALSNGAIVGIGGKCIDIAAGAPEDLSPLILAPCNGSLSQQWSLH